MAKEYLLKRSPLDRNRLLKFCKISMEHSTEDRKFVKDSYKYFRKFAEDNPNDSTVKTTVVELLKLMQASTKNESMLIELFLKVETALADKVPLIPNGKEGNSLYDILEGKSNGKG